MARRRISGGRGGARAREGEQQPDEHERIPSPLPTVASMAARGRRNAGGGAGAPDAARRDPPAPGAAARRWCAARRCSRRADRRRARGTAPPPESIAAAASSGAFTIDDCPEQSPWRAAPSRAPAARACGSDSLGRPWSRSKPWTRPFSYQSRACSRRSTSRRSARRYRRSDGRDAARSATRCSSSCSCSRATSPSSRSPCTEIMMACLVRVDRVRPGDGVRLTNEWVALHLTPS